MDVELIFNLADK